MLKGIDPLLSGALLGALQAADAFLTVATSESRPYGCFLVVTGVV